jgi:hypothetical protein
VQPRVLNRSFLFRGSARKLYSFYIDSDLATALKALKERDGTPESEAVRRGLRSYLKSKGVLRPRAAVTRRRR